MAKPFELTGQRFGKWTVVSRAENGKDGSTRWFCHCECGTKKIVIGKDLKRGQSTKCDQCKSIKHGKSRSGGEYYTWMSMLQRCENPKAPGYKDYGGRGIYIIPSWKDFSAFFADMGPRPSPNHTLDRIDNEGPYVKENCRWVTRREQSNNRRDNILVSYNGKILTLTQWAREKNISLNTLRYRLKKGWSIEDIFTTPAGPYKEKRLKHHHLH